MYNRQYDRAFEVENELQVVMRKFILGHFQSIERYASLLGFAGLGHLLLWRVDLWNDGVGIAIALGLVFLVACFKIYLEHIASGVPFWPRRGRKQSVTPKQAGKIADMETVTITMEIPRPTEWEIAALRRVNAETLMIPNGIYDGYTTHKAAWVNRLLGWGAIGYTLAGESGGIFIITEFGKALLQHVESSSTGPAQQGQ